MYSEAIFKEALEEKADGIVINSKVFNNLRYVYDTAIIATRGSLADLKRVMEKVVKIGSSRYRLFLNISKTKKD